MAPRKIPARLDVLLAPKARKAVVLRRGPAKHVCTVGWDLATDQFEMGQWFKGRIYEQFSDLSTDGKYFIYFALNEGEPDDVYRQVWRGMYFRRLIRDGWNLTGSEIDRYRIPVRRFEKKINEDWIIRRVTHEGDTKHAGQAYAHDEYVLLERKTGKIENRPDWNWADIDHHRLLWAEGGKIFSADIEAQGLGPAKMLYDFNDMTFQKIEVPY